MGWPAPDLCVMTAQSLERSDVGFVLLSHMDDVSIDSGNPFSESKELRRSGSEIDLPNLEVERSRNPFSESERLYRSEREAVLPGIEVAYSRNPFSGSERETGLPNIEVGRSRVKPKECPS